MTFKSTTNKLFSSRLIKVALISIMILLGLKLISYGIILWLIYLTSIDPDLEKVKIYASIIDRLNFSVVSGITTISTALIARYGIREATVNLKKEQE